jgi:glycosyltransferase involved in cell wall biosynthesis
MQCGVPVIGANSSSIPELVGDAGLLVDPLDGEAWTAAVDRLATDAVLHARLASAGQRRAAAFSWTRTAAQTLEVFRRAIEGRRGGRQAADEFRLHVAADPPLPPDPETPARARSDAE